MGIGHAASRGAAKDNNQGGEPRDTSGRRFSVTPEGRKTA